MVTFVVAAVFIFVVLAVFSGYLSGLPPVASLFLGAVFALAVDAIEAYGLYQRRPWSSSSSA